MDSKDENKEIEDEKPESDNHPFLRNYPVLKFKKKPLPRMADKTNYVREDE